MPFPLKTHTQCMGYSAQYCQQNFKGAVNPGRKPLTSKTSTLNTMRQNGGHFADNIFKIIFYKRIATYFLLKFHWSLLLRAQLTISQHWFSFMLNRPHAITWTNDVPFRLHIYASQDLNELTQHPSLWHAMHHWSLSPLVQVMACRLFGDKPLPVPIMTYHPDTLPVWMSKKFESKC